MRRVTDNRLIKEMTQIKKNTERKLKRRNFFFLFGAAIAGASALLNIPFKNFKSKFTGKSSAIKISENPNSVRRQVKGMMNG